MTKKNLNKKYISACANGELEVLQEMVSKNHLLLQTTIHGKYYAQSGSNNGLYYAVKNLRYNTTDFLLNSGLFITENNISLFIRTEWKGSLESYKFINHFKNRLCENAGRLIQDGWIFEYYKFFCISNNEIKKFIRILESEKFLINTQSLTNLLNEYVEYHKKNDTNPSYVSNIRELRLKILLLDQ